MKTNININILYLYHLLEIQNRSDPSEIECSRHRCARPTRLLLVVVDGGYSNLHRNIIFSLPCNSPYSDEKDRDGTAK